MRLYVTRHGQATGNRDHIIMGQRDNPLTDLGRRQASTKGKSLAASQQTYEYIYHSDLARCRETAEIIAKELGISSRKLRPDPRLREISFGAIEGEPHGTIGYTPQSFDDPFPEGESNMDMIQRVIDFIDELNQTHAQVDTAIIIVTHSGPIAVMESLASGTRFTEALDSPIDFTSINLYEGLDSSKQEITY